MKIVKAKDFKDTWIVYQSDHVSNVFLNFDELLKLEKEIKKIKEAKCQQKK